MRALHICTQPFYFFGTLLDYFDAHSNYSINKGLFDRQRLLFFSYSS